MILIPLRTAAGSCGASQLGALVVSYHILVCMFHWNIWCVRTGFPAKRPGFPSSAGRPSMAHGLKVYMFHWNICRTTGRLRADDPDPGPEGFREARSLATCSSGHRLPYPGVHVPLEHLRGAHGSCSSGQLCGALNQKLRCLYKRDKFEKSTLLLLLSCAGRCHLGVQCNREKDAFANLEHTGYKENTPLPQCPEELPWSGGV